MGSQRRKWAYPLRIPHRYEITALDGSVWVLTATYPGHALHAWRKLVAQQGQSGDAATPVNVRRVDGYGN